MSSVNIQRVVENIRGSNTNLYTPIVETVVNAIQAIEAAKATDGRVRVVFHRSPQRELDPEQGEPSIQDVVIHDNGIGFDDVHRESFDTLYSNLKVRMGGKGFGRFACLKYFDDVEIDSIYFDKKHLRRTFRMGKERDIIVGEVVREAADATRTGSIVRLIGCPDRMPKRLATIARELVEKLLPYFITEDYRCPTVVLEEADGSESIVLNSYLESDDAIIHEVSMKESSFELLSVAGPMQFHVRTFKLYSPGSRKSGLSLVAHLREVTTTALDTYIPEFENEFSDPGARLDGRARNYIVKSYVFGPYLDTHVSLERGEFNFRKEADLLFGIAQSEIERRAADLARDAVLDQVMSRAEVKRARFEAYVESSAPWHRPLLDAIDIKSARMTVSDAEIEEQFQKAKYQHELKVRNRVQQLKSADPQELATNAAEVVSLIAEASKNDLAHYVATRRQALELFDRALQLDASGEYKPEDVIHAVIFPRRRDSTTVSYEDHNLWILDERLTFTTYVSSDKPLKGGKTQRTDLTVFNRPVAFRGENEASNPVTVFEFKRPGRDDFADPASKENPVEQLKRYVNAIRNQEFSTPLGRKINVDETTPFYGYVVCDFTPKVERWLHAVQDFTPMPDAMGWFHWFRNIKLYVEVLSWDKVLKDANIRNRVFFEKLRLG